MYTYFTQFSYIHITYMLLVLIMYIPWQYARRVARQHSRKHQRSFTIGSEGEETEAEGRFLKLQVTKKERQLQLLFRSEDADVSFSSTPSTTSFPSWTPSPSEEQTSAQDQVSWAKQWQFDIAG